MNYYKYKINNFILDSRIQNSVIKLQKKYNSGKYITKTDYAIDLKNEINELYRQSTLPTFKLHLASDIPSYEHYKDMFEKAIYDVDTIIKCCKNTEYKIKTFDEESNVNINNISKSIDFYDYSIKEIESNLSSMSNIKSNFYTDNFCNDNFYVEYGNHMAYVKNGVCSLLTTHTVPYNKFDISIENGSNGFPGNTHEVLLSTSGYKYVGEVDPHIDLNSIKTDSKNKWFEFEVYNVDNSTNIQNSSIGFKYKENISWVTKNKQLHLYLKAEFDVPVDLNMIYINGLPKISKLSKMAIINEIVITDEYGVDFTVHSGKELIDTVAISFKHIKAKYVLFKFTQSNPYLTNVARVLFIPYNDQFNEVKYVNKSNSNVFEQSKSYFTMIEEESPIMSIEYLGLHYNMKDKSIIYPSTKDKYSFMTEEYIKSKLFNFDNITDGSVFTKIIQAYRYMIGISKISFEYNEYVEYSTYISKEFKSENPISRIILNSSDNIPSTYFLTGDDKSIKDGYIEYYISLNGESEWHRIYPRKQFLEGPCCIMINSSDSENIRNSNVVYIDRIDNVYTVKLKIKLRRHSFILNESPVVNSYNLCIDTI